MLSRCAHAKLVLSKDPEDVLLEFDQSHGPVGGLFDGGGQAVPDLAVGSAALNDVVGDSGAAVITGRVPGQEAGVVGDLRDVKGRGGTGLVCVGEQTLISDRDGRPGSWLSCSLPRMLTSTVAVARPQLLVASMM